MGSLILIQIFYKNPLKYLIVTKSAKFVVKVPIVVNTNDIKSVGIIILLLPILSARYPHNSELVITPMNEIVPKSPFSDVVRFNSQATGITKLIGKVSRRKVLSIVPDNIIRM